MSLKRRLVQTETEVMTEDPEVKVTRLVVQTDQQASESVLGIYLQIFLPFSVAGFGMVLAGLTLDTLQHWPAFIEHPEIFIMVPALLGLKGNLEMTLSSRLSTQANLGTFRNSRLLASLSCGNLLLSQLQAVVVGLLASFFAIGLSLLGSQPMTLRTVLFLSTTSVTTASLTTLILSTVMIIVIVISDRVSLNPDNLATPIAASLGDFTTLCVLAKVTMFLHSTDPNLDTPLVTYTLILFLYFLLLPILFRYAAKNSFTRDVLFHGWVPVISAMLISSMGGLILKIFSHRIKYLALYQPIINGVGGNIVAIQASRMSTHLHKFSSILPNECGHSNDGRQVNGLCHYCAPPNQVFCSLTNVHSRTSRILLSMVVPGHILFVLFVRILSGAQLELSISFVLVYLTACFIQVGLLLTVAHWLVHWVWSRGQDPDNAAIPYLTGLGDFLGAVLLTTGFLCLQMANVTTSSNVQATTI